MDWETILPVVLDNRQSDPTESIPIELRDLNKRFSMSDHLSPLRNTLKYPITIHHNGAVIESSYFVLLALNEEGRNQRLGAFYHLPLRNNAHFGHACDMVFVPDKWDKTDCDAWDDGNWNDRLQMCSACKPRLFDSQVFLTDE